MGKKSSKLDAVTAINVRMYRAGTGDFFILQFKKGAKVTFNLMVDCGCIQGGKADFAEKVADLRALTQDNIDLLVVTHEHADHINGFDKMADQFDKMTFKKVWFAWTEANETFANKFRKEHTKIKMAIQGATQQLTKLKEEKAFDKIYEGDHNNAFMMEATNHFVDSLSGLNELNYDSGGLAAGEIPTMEDLLRKFKVIKSGTEVKFWQPGQVIENVKGAEGIRFFVLAPPKNNDYIKKEEVKGEGYEKREKPSVFELNFLNVFDPTADSAKDLVPFQKKYILDEASNKVIEVYKSKAWRTIDNDWLMSAGALALRHESSINNTSLALAIQFTSSERILLFPGDAEQGSWVSWHDKLTWSFTDKKSKPRKVNAEYILNNTVFYKVSHHSSQNGTPKRKGLEMMKQDELAAMVTLDFKKINPGWEKTMPNDLISEELIRKTQGKLFFLGDREVILKNIRTSRVSISKANLDSLEKWNKPFDGKVFIDYEVASEA